MEVDPYILKTAVVPNASDSDENPDENRRAMHSGAIRLKFKRQLSTEERRIAANDPQPSRQRSQVGHVRAKHANPSNDENEAAIITSSTPGPVLPSTLPATQLELLDTPTQAALASRETQIHGLDDQLFPDSDSDAVSESETIVEADSRQGSAADSERSESPVSALDDEFMDRTFVGMHAGAYAS